MSFYAADALPLMIKAAEGPLLEAWHTNAPAVEAQLKDIADQIEQLTLAVQNGLFTKEQVPAMFDMEKQAGISTMAEIKGIAKVSAEEAVNAAISAVSSMINAAVGFALV